MASTVSTKYNLSLRRLSTANCPTFEIICTEDPNHTEYWCQRLLNPKKREFPAGHNSQAVEQLWKELVLHVPSLHFMGSGECPGGSFRFTLLTICIISNRLRAETLPRHYDRRAHNKDLDQAGKTKHERNRDLAYGPRRRVARPSGMVPGRLPIDEETKKSYPRGFVPGLHDKDEFGRRKFASVDPRMYSAPGVVDELRALIRKHIPENGFGRPSPSILFRARYALQQWMLGKLREEKANL